MGAATDDALIEAPTSPQQEEARKAWFLAERYLKPATEALFQRGVRAYRGREFAAAKRTFDQVVKIGAGLAEKAGEDVTAETRRPESPYTGLYRISPGDVLDVDVVAYPQFSRKVTVRSDGRFSYYFVGDVAASGKTVPGLAQDIAKLLTAYIKSPKVTVFGVSLKGSVATIMGAVLRPGEYAVEKDSRILSLIARAGGVEMGSTQREPADLRGAFLARGGRIVPVDFYGLVRHGDLKDNAALRPGDFVFVPSKTKTPAGVVTVLGAVRKPGNFPFHKGMRLLEAIGEAGDVFIGSAAAGSADLFDYNRAFLARQDRLVPVDFVRLLLHGDLAQNVELKPGDFVSIPTAQENRVFVLGEVTYPRDVRFGSQITFIQALAAAGGMSLDGARCHVYHVRGSLRKPEVREINAIAILKGRQRDFLLRANDMVYVSPTVLTEAEHVVRQIIPFLTAVEKARTFRYGHW